MTDCLFCKIIAGDIPAKKEFESPEFVAIRDVDPKAPHHLLVLPRRHIATLNDIVPEDAPLIGKMFLVARELATTLRFAEGGYRTVFNCNAHGGQTVFHLHLHLLGGRRFHWPPG